MLLAAKVSVQFWSNAFETFSPRVLSSDLKEPRTFNRSFSDDIFELKSTMVKRRTLRTARRDSTATRKLYRACMLTVTKDSQFSRRISELLNCSYFRWKLVGLFFFCGFRDTKTKFAEIEAGSLSRLAARLIAMLVFWAVISASCDNPLTATNNR